MNKFFDKGANYFEMIVGTFVLICAAWFLFGSMQSAKVGKNNSGYYVTAKFDDSDGIESGSDVKVSGVKVGNVESNDLDNKDYRSIVKFKVINDLKLPQDSSAKIASSGLLGERYLEITPGSDSEIITDGGEILFTQSSLNLEELLGKAVFGATGKSEEEKKK